MKNSGIRVFFCTAAFVLVGCADMNAGSTYTSTENMWRLGYSEIQLNNNTYRVSFAGYGIPQSLCDEFALMRAAQLTKMKGHKYFQVMDEKQSSSSQSVAMPGVTNTTGSVSRSGNVRATSYSTGTAITMNYPVTSMTIQMLDNSADTSGVFNAEIIWNSLSAKHSAS
jgi:hypothetical protein